MDFLKNLQKSVKSHHLLAIFGLVVAVAALMHYSGRKGSQKDGMQDGKDEVKEQHGPSPASPDDLEEGQFANVSDSSLVQGSCQQQPVVDPNELLPKADNNEFDLQNPQSGDMHNTNFLKAGEHCGINTVGGSLRNANLQVRSEPPNPQNNVSPWMNSTIEPDLTRVPLEIGCGPQ